MVDELVFLFTLEVLGSPYFAVCRRAKVDERTAALAFADLHDAFLAWLKRCAIAAVPTKGAPARSIYASSDTLVSAICKIADKIARFWDLQASELVRVVRRGNAAMAPTTSAGRVACPCVVYCFGLLNKFREAWKTLARADVDVVRRLNTSTLTPSQRLDVLASQPSPFLSAFLARRANWVVESKRRAQRERNFDITACCVALADMTVSTETSFKEREARLTCWTRAFDSNDPPVVVTRRSSSYSLSGEEFADVTLSVKDEVVDTELPASLIESDAAKGGRDANTKGTGKKKRFVF